MSAATESSKLNKQLLIYYPEIFAKIQEAFPVLQTCKYEACNLSNYQSILLVFGYIKDESMKIDIHDIPDCINILIKQFYFENIYEMQYISNCEVNYVDDNCLEIEQNKNISSNHNIIISKLGLNKEQIYSFRVKVIKTGVSYNGIGIVKDPQKIIKHLTNTKNQETWWMSSSNNNSNSSNNDASGWSFGTSSTNNNLANNNNNNNNNNAWSFSLNNNNSNTTNINTSNDNRNKNNSSSNNDTTNDNNNNSSNHNNSGTNFDTLSTNNDKTSNSNNNNSSSFNYSNNIPILLPMSQFTPKQNAELNKLNIRPNTNNNNNNNSNSNTWDIRAINDSSSNNNNKSTNMNITDNIPRLGTNGWIFEPHTESNINNAKLFYQHICVENDIFHNKSTDELRYEDQFNQYSSKDNDVCPQNDYNNNANSTLCSLGTNNDDTQNNSAIKTINELNERILQLEQQLIAKEVIIQNKDKQILDLKHQLNSNNKINDDSTKQSVFENEENNKNNSTKPQSLYRFNENNANNNNMNNVKTGWTWNQSATSSNNNFGDFTSSTQWSGTWNRNNTNDIDNNSGWNFGSLTRNNYNNNTTTNNTWNWNNNNNNNNNNSSSSSWSWNNTNSANNNISSSFNWSCNDNNSSNINTTSNWSWSNTNYNGRDDQLYYEFENYSDGDLCEMIIHLKKSPNKSTLTFYKNDTFVQHKLFTIKDDVIYYPYICWSNTELNTLLSVQNTNNDNINNTENTKFKFWY